jgi:hypothetical protein
MQRFSQPENVENEIEGAREVAFMSALRPGERRVKRGEERGTEGA